MQTQISLLQKVLFCPLLSQDSFGSMATPANLLPFFAWGNNLDVFLLEYLDDVGLSKMGFILNGKNTLWELFYFFSEVIRIGKGGNNKNGIVASPASVGCNDLP